jgi:hypothetical protein
VTGVEVLVGSVREGDVIRHPVGYIRLVVGVELRGRRIAFTTLDLETAEILEHDYNARDAFLPHVEVIRRPLPPEDA